LAQATSSWEFIFFGDFRAGCPVLALVQNRSLRKEGIKRNGEIAAALLESRDDRRRGRLIVFFFSLMKRSKKRIKLFSLLCLDTKKQKSSDSTESLAKIS